MVASVIQLPSNPEGTLIWVIVGLMGMLTTVVGLLVWIIKGELGKVRAALHDLRGAMHTAIIDAVKLIGELDKKRK